MKWDVITILNLQVTSTSTPLKFKDVSSNTNSCVGAALDDVVVDIYTAPLVPELPTMALPIALIVGMLCVVLFIQKSREQ